MDRSELDGARVFDHNRNLYGRRKDGSSFPIELTITGMRYDDVTKFAGIIRDITDRKRNEQLKNEFVSTVSHELRTPLTSIKGSLGLVKAGTVGELSEQAIGMVEIAYSNSERLVRLINDILDIKKIEAGKMSFQMKVQKLSALVASAMVDIAGYAEQLGVSLELSKVEWEDYVIGDADRLQQVFANLISNAAKFSPEGGKVDISVSRVGACLRVAVHDDGPGIPVKNRDSIFSKFSQVDGSDSRQTSGTGLGLNIAKSIVNSHRGGIFFECGAGAGTTFYVDLPVWEDGRDEPSSESDSEEEPEVLLYGS